MAIMDDRGHPGHVLSAARERERHICDVHVVIAGQSVCKGGTCPVHRFAAFCGQEEHLWSWRDTVVSAGATSMLCPAADHHVGSNRQRDL